MYDVICRVARMAEQLRLQELPVAAMFVNGSGRNEQTLQRTFHRCFLPSFGSFGQAVSEEKTFKNRPNRNKNCLWWPCLLTDRDEMSNRNRGEESKKSANQKQESLVAAIFVNGSRRNEQSLQRTFYRCFLPIFGSFGKAVSEEKIFRNRPIRNENCLWRPCLLMDQDEMSNLYRGPSIDGCYQVSVHLAEGFQKHISVIQF